MIKKIVTYSLVFLFVVLGLVYYNYQKQQKNLRQARQTQFSIEFETLPTSMIVNRSDKFAWKVTAPESFSTTTTGVYWSYDSSPSALTKLDSPKPSIIKILPEDYSSGLFKLPDSFDLNLKFPKAGIVYLRAYALIDKDHLWTQRNKS